MYMMTPFEKICEVSYERGPVSSVKRETTRTCPALQNAGATRLATPRYTTPAVRLQSSSGTVLSAWLRTASYGPQNIHFVAGVAFSHPNRRDISNIRIFLPRPGTQSPCLKRHRFRIKTTYPSQSGLRCCQVGGAAYVSETSKSAELRASAKSTNSTIDEQVRFWVLQNLRACDSGSTDSNSHQYSERTTPSPAYDSDRIGTRKVEIDCISGLILSSILQQCSNAGWFPN